MSLEYSTLIFNLLQTVPEIRSLYKSQVQEWSELAELPHIVFGDILNPWLVELLKENKEKEVLERIFTFLETMACCEDIKVQEVLSFTVLERLGDNSVVLEVAKKYMGMNTKKLSMQVEKFWGRR